MGFGGEPELQQQSNYPVHSSTLLRMGRFSFWINRKINQLDRFLEDKKKRKN